MSTARSARKAVRPARIRLGSSADVPLDGDLVFLIDTLYRELAVGSGFATGYAEVQKEIVRVLKQMDEATLREYFASSLFLNYVTYENEMAERLAAAITAKARRAARR